MLATATPRANAVNRAWDRPFASGIAITRTLQPSPVLGGARPLRGPKSVGAAAQTI